MNDWLVKFANQQTTDEDQLMDALGDLSIEELQEIAAYDEPQAENLETFEEKVAQADLMGRELAHLHGDHFEKQSLAFLAPLAGMAARAVGGKLLGGAAKSVAGNVAGKAIGALGGGGGGGQAAPAAGGFKYASEKNAGLASKAMGMLKKPGVGNFLKEQGKEMAINKGMQMLSGGGRAAAPAAHAAPAMAAPAQGGFSYGTGKFASVRELYIVSLEKQAKAGAAAGLGQKLLGMAVKNPNLAIGAAGALGGALMAPRDPMTGEKQWVSGALKGGLLAGGAAKLTGAGNWARKQVTTGNWGQGLKDNAVAGMRALKADKAQAAAKAAPAAAGVADMTQHAVPIPPTPAAAAAPAAAPSAVQQVLHADPSQFGVTPNGAQQVASEVAASGQGPLNKMKNMLMGQKGINVPAELQDPGKVVLGSAHFSALSPVDRIKLAMVLKHGNAGAMFSTKISPAAAGASVRSSLGGALKSGIGGAMGAARQAAKPPPIPAAARQQGGGLAGVQKQLNSAQSIAGGGPVGMGRPTITAMPGSGW